MKQPLIYTLVIAILILLACGGQKEGESKSLSTTSSSSSPKTEATTSSSSGGDVKKASSNRKGRLIYKQYCVICHGADGTLGVSNATDLTQSTTTMEERIEQITNGKGLMTPYKDILSEEQILAVAEYVEELRK